MKKILWMMLLLLAVLVAPVSVAHAEDAKENLLSPMGDSGFDWNLCSGYPEAVLLDSGHYESGCFIQVNDRGSYHHVVVHIVTESTADYPAYVVKDVESGNFILKGYTYIMCEYAVTDFFAGFDFSELTLASSSGYGSGWLSICDSVQVTNTFSSWTDVDAFTNLPVFLSTDEKAIEAYKSSGDISGASNYTDLVGEETNSYEKDNLYLSKIAYYNSHLNINPVSSAYAEWTYFPIYKGYSLDDIYIEVMYSYTYNIADFIGSNGSGTAYGSATYSLSEYLNSLRIYPYQVVGTLDGFTEPFEKYNCIDYLNGTKFTYNGDASGDGDDPVYYLDTSLLRVSFRLRAKTGTNSFTNGYLYIYDVDLLTGVAEEYSARPDDEGNYTTDDTYKTYDSSGNVTINNVVNADSGNDGGASVTVQDGNITINIENNNYNSLFGGSGDGSSSGMSGGTSGGSSSDSESSGGVLSALKDAVLALLDFLGTVLTALVDNVLKILQKLFDGMTEFLEFLFSGFGLLGDEGGFLGLLADSFPFVPESFWTVITFGVCCLIVTGVIKKFWN